MSKADPVVLGFHGTNEAAADSILREGFSQSRNDYDWLGDGVYFFQDAPNYAMQWAKQHYGNGALVIGARIRLKDCMDLLDVEWFGVLSEAYNSFLTQLKRAGMRIPHQTTGAHRLDRHVINYAVGTLADQSIAVRVVRGAFIEGVPVFPSSALFAGAHVQIAVRDTCLIEEFWIDNSGK